MKFPRFPLRESISIRNLISFHYFEYAKGFVFEGEQHDFWEFLYVDKGEVEVQADDRLLELKQGDLVFHKPDEFHTVCVRQHHKPPNLIVISFDCDSPPMRVLENLLVPIGDRERNLLSLILQEGLLTFQPPINRNDTHALHPNAAAPFASDQLIKSYLEALLIYLIRQQASDTRTMDRKLTPIHKERSDDQLLQQIVGYMKQHLSRPLTLEQLGKVFHLGKNRLKELFQAQTGTGVMEYFKLLRIEQAKSLIREKQYNFTEIAEMLGYGSIHYFSRDFKKSTGMSPSDYAKSVIARAARS